jgi:hypothetical protein
MEAVRLGAPPAHEYANQPVVEANVNQTIYFPKIKEKK